MNGPSLQLRAAGLVTALAGVTTLVTAEIVSAAFGLLAAVLIVGAALVSLRFVSDSARVARRRLAVAALALAALGALASTGGRVSDDTASALGLLLCSAAVGHSLVLDTVRDIRVNLAVSVSMLLLATGMAPGLSIAVPVVLTWCAAITTLVLAANEGQGEDVTVRATTSTASGPAGAGGSAGAIAACVAVAVLIGLAVALVLPTPPGVSARSSFGAGDDRSRTPAGGSSRTASAYLGNGPLDLGARGKLSTNPVAVVTGKANDLWRAAVLQTYDGRQWLTGNDGDGRFLGDGATTVEIPPERLSPPQPDAQTRRDGVGWLAPAGPVVISPGLPTSIDLRDTGRVARAPDGRLVLNSTATNPSYVVTSDVVPTVESVTGPETGADAEAEVWTALPASLPARVPELARTITAGTTDRASAVRAINTYFESNFVYDLDSPVTPVGADSVDDFLFNSRSGFCEHYASAEVVLLRSLGIPSRLTAGFLADRPDSDGTTLLRADNAHAWVEVWIPGSGWVSSDPTAGVPLAEQSGAGLTALFQRLLDSATGSTTSKIVLAGLLVVLAVAALLAPRLRRRRRLTEPARVIPTAPLFAAFDRYEDALGRSGRPRAPAESIRALTRRPGAGEDVAGALLTVERASYAGTPPSREDAETAVEVIDRAAARLLADVDA